MRQINIQDFHEGLYRFNAATVVLAWLDDKDFSFDALDTLVQEATEMDCEEKLDEAQMTVYSETFESVGDFLVQCGADPEAVQDFFNEECDDRGIRLASHVLDSPKWVEQADTALVESFIAGEEGETIQEAVEKVIRGGKKIMKKVRKKKRRMSGAQRSALKKARRKSNTGAAKRNRMKSMKKRSSMGL